MDYDELVKYLLEKMRMFTNYQPIVLKALLESPNVTASREQIINKLKEGNNFEERDYSQILWDVVNEVLGKQGREIAKRDSQSGDYSLDIGEINDEQKNNLIKICDEKIEEINTKNMMKLDNQQYFLLLVGENGSKNILENGKYGMNAEVFNSNNNKSMKEVKVGDLFAVYFAGTAIDHKYLLKKIYQVSNVDNDKPDRIELSLEIWKELKGIDLQKIKELKETNQLSENFKGIGERWFNIGKLTREDFENVLNIDGEKLIPQTQLQNLIDKEKKQQLTKYKTILNQSKGQIIFYGPPGTGKTYIAKELAKLITNTPLDEKWTTSSHRKIVQFHPSYSYEDFVQGIKPKKTSSTEFDYKVQPGIFQKFCEPTYINEDYETSSPNTLVQCCAFVLLRELENGGKLLTVETIYNRIKNGHKEHNYGPLFQFSGAEKWQRGVMAHRLHDFKNSIFNHPTRTEWEINQDDEDFAALKNKFVNSENIELDTSPKVLIIDEINRGNLSKIFGELIYGLEYRNEEIDLQYKEFDEGNEFGTLTIPSKEQLMIIGTMNTADRSIILFDAALRRRFSFIPLFPDYNLLAQSLDIDVAYDRKKFKVKLTGMQGEQKNKILSILALDIINSQLAEEKDIGREKQIGHTFLLELQEKPENFEKVWKRDILPLLEEYYFDRPEKIEERFGDKIYTVKEGIKEFDENTLREQLTNYITSQTKNDESN
jgi:5-methylcytosine-specific restriction endonuclease McrBC GTP-binding regulatory subunit McrB